MNDLQGILRRILRDIGERAEAALVGAIAVSARTEPRFTRDVDLAVAVSDDREAERLVSDLSESGWRVLAVVEHESANRLATVRLLPPGEPEAGRVADLLFASSGIEPEIVAAAEDLEVLPKLRARVARLAHLIVMKVLARADDRPQDAVDLQALAERALPRDLDEALEAARLVTERGFHRGRDLAAEIELLRR